MEPYDWTQDDSLSEAEIRARWEAEGWEPVEALSSPVVTAEPHLNNATQRLVWSHSEPMTEQVRVPA